MFTAPPSRWQDHDLLQAAQSGDSHAKAVQVRQERVCGVVRQLEVRLALMAYRRKDRRAIRPKKTEIFRKRRLHPCIETVGGPRNHTHIFI